MKKNQDKKGIFLVIILIILLIIAAISLIIYFLYGGQIHSKDPIKECVLKIVTTAEAVYYSGEPSKATITCQLPDTVINISIIENNYVFISNKSTSGEFKTGYTSKAPLQSKQISTSGGLKRFRFDAKKDYVEIIEM